MVSTFTVIGTMTDRWDRSRPPQAFASAVRNVAFRLPGRVIGGDLYVERQTSAAGAHAQPSSA
jgi:hypothetical protein